MSDFHCHYPESLFSAIAGIRRLWNVLTAVSWNETGPPNEFVLIGSGG
jgi:hypothetical protein